MTAGLNKQLNKQLNATLGAYGYRYKGNTVRGCLYENVDTQSAIITDYKIHHPESPFPYTDYTREQNHLMGLYCSLYRFVIDEFSEIEVMDKELKNYLSKTFNEEKLVVSGQNRNIQAIDPTMPEAIFEQVFIDTYGREALDRVTREYPVIDINGNTRWVDYYIQTSNFNLAIEKNGETYHHPILTGKKKYKAQLLKQNSIVAYGGKVFRWSMEGMKFRDKFSEEMKMYFGDLDSFKLAHHIKQSRGFKLFDHQENILESIKEERAEGKQSFLVVLPTGTGKTEVMLSDLEEQIKEASDNFKALVMVPQVQLKQDLITLLKKRFSHYNVGDKPDSIIMIQTYAWMSRYYEQFSSHNFSYMVVDEAHHASAPTVHKVIQHFIPETLLGLTATDKRLDEKRLEDIFGQYETSLSLLEAIEKNVLVPIKAFRLKSNIDLSSVRFNGKDYYASDLQKNVIVEARDQLIVEMLNKYFVSSQLEMKSGLVFCVSVAHAKRLAKMMKNKGISVEAISGQDNKSSSYIEKYQSGEIQFLTTCSLLNEGWDSPRTSIIVMARPTMSKVLYTQQLGRGTRKMTGKEALYIIDVVDNYGCTDGFNNSPWSVHALLGIDKYCPWSDITGRKNKSGDQEELLLAGLYEKELSLEQINIFTFEQKYPDFLSTEQLARELFVSTGTVNSWLKKDKFKADITVPVGKIKLCYFSPDQVSDIRKIMKLKIHNELTQYDDFFEFINEGNYTYSYKMILILSLLNSVDANGECNLESLTKSYIDFYKERLTLNVAVDRDGCPYSDINKLNDVNYMQRSLLANPFEKFERKRFMFHCKDLNHIAFSTILWDKINNKDDLLKIKRIFFHDLLDYYESLGKISNQEELIQRWNIPENWDKESLPGKVVEWNIHNSPPENELYNVFIPLYDLQAAAGAFSESQPVEPLGWVQPKTHRKLNSGLFVAQVVGHSMEPRIPGGSYCLFKAPVTGTRNGRIVLAQHNSIEDPEHAGRYTVKEYASTKQIFSEDNTSIWRHSSITLKALNPDYEDILVNSNEEEIKIIAEFLEVVDPV